MNGGDGGCGDDWHMCKWARRRGGFLRVGPPRELIWEDTSRMLSSRIPGRSNKENEIVSGNKLEMLGRCDSRMIELPNKLKESEIIVW